MTIILYTSALLMGITIAYFSLPKILDFIIAKSQKRGFYNGAWKSYLKIGLPEISKVEKAAIARVGLGSNSAEETVYWNAFIDSDGNELSTRNTYEIVIAKEPPIDFTNNGFWSITAYGEDQFLMQNKFNKFMIQHKDLHNVEAPYKITLSSNEKLFSNLFIPLSEKEQKFTLALRCYRPKEVMTQYESCKEIELPIIRKIR